MGETSLPRGIAVDSSDNLYVILECCSLVKKLSSTGANLGLITGPIGTAHGLAVDPATNDLYVNAGGTQIDHYAPACDNSAGQCTPVDSFGSSHLNGAAGLAVDPSNKTVYAADTGDGRVDLFGPPPPAPPSIDAAAGSMPSSSTADLTAKINPNQRDATYHFEYGTDISYGTSVPVADVDIGAGTSDVPVSTHLSGLSASTTYHWRVVARNSLGTTTSPDHTFVYDTSGGGLPDNRAYEMVTPPEKNGALIGAAFFAPYTSISEDGSRVIIDSIQCFAGAGSCTADRQSDGEVYAFTRSSGGWLTTPLAPSETQFNAPNSSWRVSADAGTSLLSVPTPPGGQDDWYARQPDGSFHDIGPITPPAGGAAGISAYAGSLQVATGDLSHVVWDSERVWPFDAATEGNSVYEYVGSGNAAPVLVGVSGGAGSTDLISKCGTQLGGKGGNSNPYGSLSADGRTVYFTASVPPGGEPCPSGSGANAGIPVPVDALYARIDQSRTIPVSQRSPLDCTSAACQSSPPGGAMFEGASVDGSKVFFTDTQQLTDNASQDSTPGDTASGGAGGGCLQTTGAGGCNLYLYDSPQKPPTGHNLIDVSAGDTSGNGPRVQGVMAISSDGSHVYFVANGVLSGSQQNSSGVTATDGAENLYVFERDAQFPAGRIMFIATLSCGLNGGDCAQWTSGVGVANVTPDGRFLVFTSRGAVTGDVTRTDGAAQVFRYDAQTGELVRVSIGEHGFSDNGNAGTGDASFVPAYKTFYRAGPARPDPTMSHDGAYVFFQSPVALTPHALDDVRIDTAGDLAQNIYEYHDGHVYLISDGRDVSTSATECGSFSAGCLVGSDATGANVFFTTADRLVAQDTDTQLDYYDARICSAGDPCIRQPPPPLPPCLGEACHGTPAATPSLLTPGSSSFNGEGNISSTPLSAKKKVTKKAVKCAKGKKRSHGKCVKRAKRSSRHSKDRTKR
jgi:hypothetical protein